MSVQRSWVRALRDHDVWWALAYERHKQRWGDGAWLTSERPMTLREIVAREEATR